VEAVAGQLLWCDIVADLAAGCGLAHRTLVPEAEQFFDTPGSDDALAVAMATSGNWASPVEVEMMYTAASMIAAVNSILGGAGLALLAAKVAHLGIGSPGGRRCRRGDRVWAAPAVRLPAGRTNGRMANDGPSPCPPVEKAL
jgi:hypothetical protein